VDRAMLTVKSAFSTIPANATAQDAYPAFSSESQVAERLAAIPCDGGSWIDLIGHKRSSALLTDAMKRIIRLKKLGSHPDVYGRMAWNRPAPTIKRECAHIGNGRYAHPVENRLCSIRELATLQGFPCEFEFNGNSLSNNYRHIGDAVPPLISFQIASVCSWILTGVKPPVSKVLLSGTHLKPMHLVRSNQLDLIHAD
jgi:DNA (cytosine-5)-methyltransferase 1